MVLSLTANGIQSDAADSGTYTWADVVALNSPFLTTHTQASGRPFYRWTGLMLIQGSAILDAWLIALELLGTSDANPGIIQARSTAKVNFARKRILNGKPFYDKGCQIIVTRTRYFNPSATNAANDLATAPLSGNLDGTSEINIYGSSMILSNYNNVTDTNKRVYVIVKNLESSNLTGEGLAPFLVSNGAFLSAPVNSSYLTNVFANCVLEITNPSGVVLSGNTLYDSGLGAYNDAVTTRLGISALEQNLEFQTDPTVCHRRNGVDYINSPNYSLSNQFIYAFGNTDIQNHRKLYTHDLRIKSGSNNIQNALVVYTGRTNLSFTSGSNGLISQLKLVAQETDLANTGTPNGFSYNRPLPLVDYSAYTRQVRSYLHEAVLEDVIVDSQIGNTSQPFIYSLAIDSGITQTNQSLAAAVTGINHTATTITISASRSIAEIYDSRKAYQRDNGGITGHRVGATADFFALNITILATAAISPSTVKFLDGMQISGTITLTDARAYNGIPFAISAGGSVIVGIGTTDLRTWAFATGSVINKSGIGSSIVTVAADQLANVIPGVGVTIQSPPVTFTAASITNGFDNVRCRTSLYLRRTFSPATDVNLATNRITIAGASGKITQNTVIRFAGTDIPHPLEPDNVYYPFAISGSSFSVSGLSGGLGAEVDLTNIGSGSMLLIAITELDMQLINSGASYTFSLSGAASTGGVSLTSGDTLLLQALSWKGSLHSFSPAIASKYLEEFQQFSGSSISTLSKIQPYPEHNTFAIQQATDGYQISLLTVAGSTPIRYQWRVDGGSPGKVQIESEDPDRVISTELAVLFFQFVQWSVIGMRVLRGQIQAENLNSIQIRSLESGVSTDLTIESLPPGIPLLVSGAGMYRTDGKSWIAPGSPIQHQPTALVAVPIEIKVPINLSEPIVQLLHTIAAGVGFLTTSNGGGGGGGSSLTQQQIRDALTLATVQSPAVGSIDSKLDNAGSDFVIL